MFEASKTRRLRGNDFIRAYFSGSVLDIGCGPDLVVPHAQPFDLPHGDANRILDYLPPESFDCVHSSHCLEHMHDPVAALRQWWALVRPNGYLIVVVPEEDLYEQGIWPSPFNSDHKSTFRCNRPSTWSPVSYDIHELVAQLPASQIVDSAVHDVGYDRRALSNAPAGLKRCLLRIAARRQAIAARLMRHGMPVYRLSLALDALEIRLGRPVDQTMQDALAQIQVVARKLAPSHSLDQQQDIGTGVRCAPR